MQKNHSELKPLNIAEYIFVFKQLYNFTNLDGSLSTFSVAGHIRRGLLKAGFKVSKVSGYGNKKEISYAIKKDLIGSNQYKFSYEKKIGPVAIIGSGISGASIAYALRKRNIECFIIDKSYKIANGASGNKLALQMPKLTMDDSPYGCLLYTSPSPRDRTRSRMPSSA